MNYWQEYYQRNKKNVYQKIKKWRKLNSDKVKEYNSRYKENDPERHKEILKKAQRKWISFDENRQRKNKYQSEYNRNRKEFKQEENLEFGQLEQALNRGQNIIRGYIVELKQDREGKWFYYLLKFGALYFISDKFETRKQAIKDLQYAI